AEALARRGAAAERYTANAARLNRSIRNTLRQQFTGRSPGEYLARAVKGRGARALAASGALGLSAAYFALKNRKREEAVKQASAILEDGLSRADVLQGAGTGLAGGYLVGEGVALHNANRNRRLHRELEEITRR